MAFPITLPDGSTVNIVTKSGGEPRDERFTDENGNVYMRNLSGGMSRSFVLVTDADTTLIGFEDGVEPSADQDVTPVTEDEPADGDEVVHEIEFEDGSTAEIELDPESVELDLDPDGEDWPSAA